MPFRRFITAIVVVISLPTSFVAAQGSTGTILGTMWDMTGAVLPGVTITVKHVESGLTRTTVSNEDGGYTVPLLPVGIYQITTSMPSFKQELRSGISLGVGQEAVIDLTLEVGGSAETVIVTAETPLVNNTLSSTSGFISEQQVKDLPLNGRSFDQLLTLNVGITNNGSNIPGGWTGFSVAGHRQENNRFLINGVDWIGGNANGLFITPSGASGQLLGVEAVREFNVMEHTYGADYGKQSGGQISVVTSSGTNQWHGDLFEYVRNRALDARDFFAVQKGPFKRNQFGGAIGGPLKKDKAFVFGTYEAFRQRLAQSSRAIVPDAQARLGFLPCNVIGPAANPCPASGYALVPNLKPGVLPFATAFWPAPNGPEVLVNGLPSGTAYNFNSALQSVREDFGLLRLDYILSSRDSLFGNYTISDGERDTPQANPEFIQLLSIRSQTLGIRETHVFSSNVLNAATFGWARADASQVNNPVTPIPASLLFLAGGNPGSITIGGGSNVGVGAAAIVQANGVNLFRGGREYYTWADDLRFDKRKHSFTAGAWIQQIQQNMFGLAQFSAGGVTYSSLLTFLQDVPTQFNIVRNAVPVSYRTLEGAWYFQDEMRLRPNLTIRLGLRHEMTNGWNEVARRCSNYPIDSNYVVATEPVIGHACLAENHAKLLLQPRVGLAWDPTGTGSWAVRAGFGIHNDLQDNLGNRVYANPPFNAREQLAGPLLSLGLPLQRNVAPPPTCGPAVTGPCSIYSPAGVDPNLLTPTHRQWSLTVEHGIARDLLLQAGYVGTQSYHTPIVMDANTPMPQVCQNEQGCVSGGTTSGGAPVPAAQRGLVPRGAVYMPPSTRPNPYVGNTQTWFNIGTSSYHALTLSLAKRMSRGVAFKTNYTWGKVIDLNSGIAAPTAANEPPDVFSPYNLELNRGVASYSLAHQFNGNFSYQLPFGHGQRIGSGASDIVDTLIGGWQWNGIVNWQGGFPFTPLVGSNTSGTGDTNLSDVPNWNPDFHGKVILGKPDQWFDPRAFSLPTQGTFGNVARGSLRGPGLFSFDTSLLKRMKINESMSLQFRAEAFNILNHPNFSSPNPIVFSGGGYSPSAGVITATATTSRQIQFALKLLF